MEIPKNLEILIKDISPLISISGNILSVEDIDIISDIFSEHKENSHEFYFSLYTKSGNKIDINGFNKLSDITDLREFISNLLIRYKVKVRIAELKGYEL